MASRAHPSDNPAAAGFSAANRAQPGAQTIGSAVSGRVRQSAQRRLLAAADVARTALARFPGDPEFINLRQTLTPWLELLGRRS